MASIFSQCKNRTCIQNTENIIKLQGTIAEKNKAIKDLQTKIDEKDESNQKLQENIAKGVNIVIRLQEQATQNTDLISTLKLDLENQQKQNLSNIRTALLQGRIIALMTAVILGLSAYLYKIQLISQN